MDIGKKVIDGVIGTWVTLYVMGFVILGAFFIYESAKIVLGYPSVIDPPYWVIRGH